MAFDAFLKIDGIPGESTDFKHKNEIEVLSFSFGVAKNDKGRPQVNDFSIVKRVDTASPLLFDSACQGEVAKNAFFTARKAGDKAQLEFIKIEFEEVIVSSIQPSGAAGTDSLPMESVSLNFQSMEMEVFRQNPDGTIGGSTKTVCTAGRRKD